MQDLLATRAEAASTLVERFVDTGQLPVGWEGHADPTGYKVDLDLVKELCLRAATLLKVEEMDPWLAPRLHVAIRIPRRTAVQEGMWTWLALHCHDFIEARFRRPNTKVHPWRYHGVWSRNGLSRLWWGAEMTRNGPSYLDVPNCFKRVRTAQFALELMYSWHRPAAIAFTRVAEGSGGPRLNDDQLRTLSTRLRVLLSLQCLEIMGGETLDVREEFDEGWAQRVPSLASLMGDVSGLEGPSAGACEASSITEFESWFRDVLAMQGTAAPVSTAGDGELAL